MWTWTKVAGRALINLGVVVLAIAAAKELIDTGSAVVGALRSGSKAPEPPDTHSLHPMA